VTEPAPPNDVRIRPATPDVVEQIYAFILDLMGNDARVKQRLG
jgi:hypothetical protein